MPGDRPEFQYTLELYRKDRPEHLATVRITPDWEPALEWASFTALRHNRDGPVTLDGTGGQIEPCWDGKAGSPYLAGFRAMVRGGGRPSVEFPIPLAYVSPLAERAASVLVDRGTLAAGERFLYLVCAYPCQNSTLPQEATDLFSVKPVAQVLDANECSLDAFLADSVDYDADQEDQMPVLIPRIVLEEAVQSMRTAGAVETGGILLGKLHRDARHGIFLEVTAQIPAQHVQQELTRLTFTPDTWAAVDAAMALRGRGEIYAGWWHSHPSGHWCDQCPPETREKCSAAGQLSGNFFSVHDVALHRAVFPRAYSIALVFSDGCQVRDAVVWKLFGWHYGMLTPRGFHIVGGSRQQEAADAMLVDRREQSDVSTS